MSSECIVDAHSLLWFIEGNSKLGPDARMVMADADNRLIIPAIALAEACRVAEKGKTTIPSVSHLFAAIDADLRMSVSPIDRDLVQRSVDLRAVTEMHDRLIVATAMRQRERTQSAFLVSADANIRSSGLVPIRW